MTTEEVAFILQIIKKEIGAMYETPYPNNHGIHMLHRREKALDFAIEAVSEKSESDKNLPIELSVLKSMKWEPVWLEHYLRHSDRIETYGGWAIVDGDYACTLKHLDPEQFVVFSKSNGQQLFMKTKEFGMPQKHLDIGWLAYRREPDGICKTKHGEIYGRRTLTLDYVDKQVNA